MDVWVVVDFGDVLAREIGEVHGVYQSREEAERAGRLRMAGYGVSSQATHVTSILHPTTRAVEKQFVEGGDYLCTITKSSLEV